MQQINLYLAEFQPRRDWLSAPYCAAFCGGVLLLMLVLTVLDNGARKRTEARAQALEAQSEALRARVAELKRRSDPSLRESLQQDIEVTREALRNREAISELMSGRSLGNPDGFSTHFVGLGLHRVEGVVLQGFTLYRGGAALRLEGMSQKPELVPLYVTRLQTDARFANTVFGYLSLQAMGDAVEFLLSGDGAMSTETLSQFAAEQL